MVTPSGIVVVGTSLGGLKALQILLRGFSANFPLPIAVAQHRCKGADDGLARILADVSALHVCEPEDKQAFEPGTVYLAPADYHLLVEGKYFSLSTDPPENYARPSIDLLFESAAYTFGPAAIGVVMTGSNSDGAQGAAAIKRRGGTVVVQDPATAERPEMPQAVLSAVSVDQILPLDSISHYLCDLCAPLVT